MTEERKVQLGVSVDATGAKQGLNDIKREAQSMAQAVAQSGKDAGKAIDNIGSGGDASAKKVDSATKSMIQSIQRTTAVMEAGSKTSAKYYETLAAQRGVDINALRPYLQQLDAVAEKQRQAQQALSATNPAMQKLGVSAAQTAAAMRQVPAQFTDIVTALQSGQAPMTVLLQQGGQLKDAFGGIGPAAKALGGYITGLINPFTLAAAAGVGLALAAHSGRAEFDALNNTLKMTGGYTGLTIKQINDMAERLGAAGAGVGNATEAIKQLIATGRVGGDQLESLATAALQISKATGTGIKEAVSSLSGLTDDAVKWAEKYNEQFHFMSAAQYNLAKQYEETGDKAAATKVVIESLQEAHTRMYSKASEELGDLERAVEFWSSAYEKVKRFALSIGKPDTNFDKINKALEDRAKLEDQLKFAQDSRNGQEERRITKLLEWNKNYINSLRQVGDAEKEQAAKAKERAEEQARAQTLGNYLGDTRYADKKTKYALEVQKENEAFKKAVSGFKETSEEYKQALIRHNANLAQIAEQNKDKGAIKAVNKELSDQAKLMLELSGLSGSFSKDWDDLSKMYKRGELSLADLTKAQAALLAKQPIIRAGIDAETKAREELAKAAEKMLEAGSKEIKSLEEQIRKQEEHNASIGLSKDAAADLAAQKYDLAAASDEELASNLRNAAAYAGELHDAYLQHAADLEMAAKLKRKLASDIRIGGATQAAHDAAEEAAKEWKRSFEDISRSLTDNIMRGGKNAGEYLKDYFRTLVLRPIVQAAVNPVAGALTNFLGFGQPANAAGSAMQGMNMFSAGQTLFDGFSSAASTVGGWLGMGGATSATAIPVSGVAAGSAGTGAAAAGSSAGSALSAAGPYIAAAAIAYAIWKSMDDSGTPHTGGAAEANANGVKLIDGRMIGTAYIEPTEQGTAMAKSFATGISTMLNSTAKTFGKTAGYEVATAFADDSSDDGAWGALFIKNGMDRIVDWNQGRTSDWAPREYSDGEAGFKQYSADLGKSVRDALEQVGLPGWAKNMLDSLGDAPSIEQLSTVVDQITATQSALVNMGKAISGFANMSDATVTALIKAAGGIQSLSGSVDSYYQNFYSEDEKVANVTRQITETLSAVGLAMPATREEFRSMVDAQIALGEAGAPAVAALLNVSGAFASIIPAAAAAGDAVDDAVDSISDAAQKLYDDAMKGVDTAFSALQRAVDAERKSITKAYNNQVASFNDQINAITGSVSKLTALSGSLRSTIDKMRLPSERVSDRNAAIAKIDTALLLARTGGVLPDAESLRNALEVVSQPSEDLFATFTDYQRDFLAQRGKIEELARLTDAQKTIEERTLDSLRDQLKATEQGYQDEMTRLDGILSFAQQQIDTLNGIDTSIKSVAAAIAGLQVKLGAAATAQAGVSQGAGTQANSITGLYQNILGRSADAEGAAFWQQALVNNPQPWDVVVRDFVNGAISGGTTEDKIKALEWAKANHIPGFAVGTNRVPEDMLAVVHKDERIIPAADNRALLEALRNPQDNASAMAAEIRALREEVIALRIANSAENRSIAQHTNKTAKAMERAMPDGDAFATRAAT